MYHCIRHLHFIPHPKFLCPKPLYLRLLNLLKESLSCHIVTWASDKYQIHLLEHTVHCPKYQILSAFELVARKLFIVTLLLPVVAKSQIGEAGFTLQLLLLWKMTIRRCLIVSRDLLSSSSAGFLPSLLLRLFLLCPPLCGVEAGNSVVHRGNIQNHFHTAS